MIRGNLAFIFCKYKTFEIWRFLPPICLIDPSAFANYTWDKSFDSGSVAMATIK